MDPNVALTEWREALVALEEATSDESALDASAVVLELSRTLDGWLSKGGFLPREWEGKS